MDNNNVKIAIGADNATADKPPIGADRLRSAVNRRLPRLGADWGRSAPIRADPCRSAPIRADRRRLKL